MEDEWQCAWHFLCLDNFAIHFERSGTALSQSAVATVFDRSKPLAVVLEVELDCVAARSQYVGTFPLNPFKVDQVPEKDRLALQKVEAVPSEATAGGDNHTFSAAFGDCDVRRERVGAIKDHRRIALRQTGHRPGVDELGSPGGDVWPRCDDQRGDRRVHWEDLVLFGFFDEELLQLLDLFGVLGGQVLRLAEVLGQVVELEDLVIEWVGVGRAERFPRRAVDLGRKYPALVIQGPLSKHLEVLRLVPRWYHRILRVESVGEAGTLDGGLFDAVHVLRRGDTGHFQQRRYDVHDVHELLAQGAIVLDAIGPGDAHALADAAEPRSVLLKPREGRVEGPGPTRGHVVVGLFSAPVVIPFHLLGDRHHVDAVEKRHLVGRAERAAFGTGAIVSVDVDDERIVELAHVLNGLNDTADLVVIVGGIGGEDLHLPDEEFLFLCS